MHLVGFIIEKACVAKILAFVNRKNYNRRRLCSSTHGKHTGNLSFLPFVSITTGKKFIPYFTLQLQFQYTVVSRNCFSPLECNNKTDHQ